MNDTREGEGVTREFATGSITSSRVMELMSNQASEMFQPVKNSVYQSQFAVPHVVKSLCSKVQSLVQVRALEPPL